MVSSILNSASWTCYQDDCITSKTLQNTKPIRDVVYEVLKKLLLMSKDKILELTASEYESGYSSWSELKSITEENLGGYNRAIIFEFVRAYVDFARSASNQSEIDELSMTFFNRMQEGEFYDNDGAQFDSFSTYLKAQTSQ